LTKKQAARQRLAIGKWTRIKEWSPLLRIDVKLKKNNEWTWSEYVISALLKFLIIIISNLKYSKYHPLNKLR
jgi:hypothetical protein